MKRVSLIISSRKHPGQTFVGYALLHEFNPKRLSFFTAHKFPVDDEIEIQTDFFGSRAQAKAIMTNIHEQISSGRVMNAVPDEANPFPVRKFYRCYAEIRSLEGALPGMQATSSSGELHASGPTLAAVPNTGDAAVAPQGTPGASPEGEAQAAPENLEAQPSKESVVEETVKPKDSDDIKAKLAALSDPNAAPTGSSEKIAA